MHQCEVIPSNENVEDGSLHLGNKGAGEDVTEVNDASAAVSTSPGLLLFTCSEWKICINLNTRFSC